MTETRTLVLRRVERDVGVHFNELVRTSDWAPGQLQYHLRRLKDDGDVVSESYYGRTHFYTPELDGWERGAIALFRRETPREVVAYLVENERSRPADVADDVGVARSTLEHHLQHLVERGVVAKEHDESNHVWLRVDDRERTAELLETVTPTVSERVVDRFTRLVDGLLEDADSGVDRTFSTDEP